MGKGGGSPAPQTSTVNQSNLPEYARPYFEDLMQRGQTASQVQYQPYGGERTAGFTPMQEQGFQGVQNLGPSSLNAPAAGMTTAAGLGGLSAGQYQPMAAQQMYQGPQFQGMGLQYLNTQAPNLQQYQMGPAQQVRGEQTGAAQTNYAPNLQQYQMGPAERTGTGSFAAPGAAAAYMSPYAQQAIDPTLRENQRQFDVASAGRQAAATRSGAFGGSRQAIEQSEAQRNLGRLQSDTQAQGMQAAYQQAQQAYQTDAQRQLQSQMSNQQAGLTVGGQNLQSALGVQQLGSQTGLQTSLANQQAMQQAMMANQQTRQQAALANQQAGLTTGQQNLQSMLQTQGLGAQTGMQSQQLNQAAQLQAQQQGLGQSQAQNAFNQQNAQLAAQYGMAGLQAGEQSRQFGANLGLQGLGLAGQMGQQLGQLGQTAFGQEAAAAQAQQTAGATQQAQSQDILNRRYEDFMQQQTFPQSQLQNYSALLRGVPVSPNQTMYQYQAPASGISQLAGLGMGAYGMSRAFGARDGGAVPGYAEGGPTGGITGGPEGQPTTLEVSKIKTDILKGADPRSFPPSIALLLAISDPRVKDAIDTREGAKVQAALDQGRQNAQLPSIMEEQMAQLEPSGGIAGLDMGAMETAEYDGGGIIAFKDGLTVPPGVRYEPEEPAATPFGRFFQDISRGQKQNVEEEYLRRELMKKFGPQAGLRGLFTAQSDESRARAQGILDRSKGMSLAELRDFSQNPEAGLPATLPQSVTTKPYTAAMMDADNPPQLAAPAAAPKPAPAARAPAARAPAARAPAAPATATPPGTPQAPPSLLYTGKSPEQAFTDREAEMERRFPSEKDARLAEIKEQAASAIKERDADRWMALALGGFSIAANAKPGARGLGGFLGDLGAGLQLTTKELAGVNKEFRKSQALRTAAEREERKADRLESMQKYDASDKARTRVEDIKRQANQAQATLQVALKGLAIKKTEVDVKREALEVERDKVSATRDGTLAYREAVLGSRNITAFNGAVQKEKELLQKSMGMMTATPDQLEQQAIRNVITRNPKFAGLAGVSAADPFAQPPLPKGVKVTRE